MFIIACDLRISQYLISAVNLSALVQVDNDGVDVIPLESKSSCVFGRPEKAHVTFKHDVRPSSRASLHLTFPHQSISRQQAALVHCNGKWYLIDLKSAFGTCINGQKVEPYTPTEVPCP